MSEVDIFKIESMLDQMLDGLVSLAMKLANETEVDKLAIQRSVRSQVRHLVFSDRRGCVRWLEPERLRRQTFFYVKKALTEQAALRERDRRAAAKRWAALLVSWLSITMQEFPASADGSSASITHRARTLASELLLNLEASLQRSKNARQAILMARYTREAIARLPVHVAPRTLKLSGDFRTTLLGQFVSRLAGGSRRAI